MSGNSIIPAEVREHVDGNLDRLNDEFLSHTGWVDGDAGELLSFLRDVYDPDSVDGELPAQFEETKFYRQVVSNHATEKMTKAIETGNESLMSFGTGVTNQGVDSGAMVALRKLSGFIRPAGRVCVMAGGTNNGKTNVGALLIECFKFLFPEGLVASNVAFEEADYEYEEFEEFGDLEEWTAEYKKTEKIIFIDDASIDHSESSQNIHEIRQRQGQLVRLAAKRHARLVYVGHRDNDITPAIRDMPDSLFFVCARILDDHGNPEDFTCSVFDGLDEDGRPSDRMAAPLVNLPEAETRYNPDVEANNLFATEL